MGLYYLCSENKGADHLRGYPALVSHICKKQVPACMGKWVPYGQNQGMMPKLDPCGSHIGILAHVGPT